MDAERFDALAKFLSSGITRRHALHGLVGTTLVWLAGWTGIEGGKETLRAQSGTKTWICHRTNSDTNQYEYIEVSMNAVDSHRDHHGDAFDVDLLSNNQHCGECGNACDASQQCVGGACQLRCSACQRFDTAGGMCVSNCPSLCDDCIDGQCVPKQCNTNHCETCNPATGQCEGCGPCGDCFPGGCVQRCNPNHCQFCIPATGRCGGGCANCQACDVPTQTCYDACNPNHCQSCDLATGTCAGGCAICQRCDVENQVCLDNCNPNFCQICDLVGGVCVDRCEAEGKTCQSGQCV